MSNCSCADCLLRRNAREPRGADNVAADAATAVVVDDEITDQQLYTYMVDLGRRLNAVRGMLARRIAADKAARNAVGRSS